MNDWYRKSIAYLKEVNLEMKKVTWPTKPEVVGTTGVVVVVSVIFAVFLYGMDLVFSKILAMVIGY